MNSGYEPSGTEPPIAPTSSLLSRGKGFLVEGHDGEEELRLGLAASESAEPRPSEPWNAAESGEFLCPAGHPLSTTGLKFFEGRFNEAKCSQCGGSIKRQQIRHCCQLCDYLVCLTCFERLHLQKHMAAVAANRSSTKPSQIVEEEEEDDIVAARTLKVRLADNALHEDSDSGEDVIFSSDEDEANSSFGVVWSEQMDQPIQVDGESEEGSSESPTNVGATATSANYRESPTNVGASPTSSTSPNFRQQDRWGATATSAPFGRQAAPASRATAIDPSAGRGFLRIPEALREVTLDVESLLEATPPTHLDLRRFMRAGDILNYQGGNRWGHTVLCLATPKVFEVPKLLDGVTGKVLGTRLPIYIMKVLQSASNLCEICISTCCLVVHPDTMQVCAAKDEDDQMQLCVGRDGNPIHPQILLSPLSNSTLDFEILRLAIEEVRHAPQDQAWSLKTAVRAYLRSGALLPENYPTKSSKRDLAWKMGMKWRERPVCSSVPPRVWQKYLLKRCQKVRADLPSSNSDGSVMSRGGASGSHLLYCGKALVADQIGGDMQKTNAMQEASSEASHGGRTSWKKNANQEDVRCGPLDGRQCARCLEAQWALPSDDPDPEVAWAEDVLRLVPVKDDRVMPQDLCQQLVQTGLWQSLNFQRGPPLHRRGDEAPAEADYYNATDLSPFQRAALPVDLRNAEGALVQLGEHSFTVYCGRQVAKPQKIANRVVARADADVKTEGEFFMWDGKCGPSSGPQCTACQRLEDRLVA